MEVVAQEKQSPRITKGDRLAGSVQHHRACNRCEPSDALYQSVQLFRIKSTVRERTAARARRASQARSAEFGV